MSNNFLQYLKKLGVKLKVIKDQKPIEVKVTINQSTVDDIKKLHNIDVQEELTNVIENEMKQNKSELNQITVKMTVLDDLATTGTTEPIKKKRTYNKKPKNNSAEPKKPAPIKKNEKNGTTKRTNRKPPKKNSSI